MNLSRAIVTKPEVSDWDGISQTNRYLGFLMVKCEELNHNAAILVLYISNTAANCNIVRINVFVFVCKSFPECWLLTSQFSSH